MPRQKSYDVEPFSIIRAATEKDNYPTTTISLWSTCLTYFRETLGFSMYSGEKV